MRYPFIAAAAVALGLGVAMVAPSAAQDSVVNAPAPRLDPAVATPHATAVFAGGCFWGVQGVFAHVKGVESTVAGYTGGTVRDPDYETVSGGNTGHAESVKVTYDPRQVSYGSLLRIYFSVVADPTMLDAQGPDEGTQYRSALFPQTAQQAQVAKAYLAQLKATHLWQRPIVTAIEAPKPFYPAEGYHQDFMRRNPSYPYIVINDRPKVEALHKLFPASWKA
jgi:peptide-methionine (S)-S-oxide reductase